MVIRLRNGQVGLRVRSPHPTPRARLDRVHKVGPGIMRAGRMPLEQLNKQNPWITVSALQLAGLDWLGDPVGEGRGTNATSSSRCFAPRQGRTLRP